MTKESHSAHLALAHVQFCHVCVIYAGGSKFMAGCLRNLVILGSGVGQSLPTLPSVFLKVQCKAGSL